MTELQLDRNLQKKAPHQCDVLLRQSLPLAYVVLKKPSTTKNEKYFTSEISLKYEDNSQKFEKDLPDTLMDADFPMNRYPALVNEAETNIAFKENVLTPLVELFDFKFEIRAKPNLQAFEPDFALLFQKEPFLIIEGKQWNSLIDIDLKVAPTSQTVVDKLEHADLPRHECQSNNFFKKNVYLENETLAQFNFRMGLKQLVTYLSALKLEKSYGILTSYCHTYFVILDQAQNKLEISPVARYCDTDILRRIAKFIYLALTAERKPIEATTFLSPKKAGFITGVNEVGDSSSKEIRGHNRNMIGGTGEGSDRVLRCHRQGNTGHEQGNTGHRQGNTGHEQGNTGHRQGNTGHGQGNTGHRQGNTGHGQGNTGHGQGNTGHGQGNTGHRQGNTGGQRKHFCQYVVGETLGEGRSGCVLKITNDKGQSFAAKCIGDKRGEDVLSELHNEKAIYKKLKNLQGEVVPLFHCSGYLYNSLYTLVLDNLDADTICNLKLSDEEKEVIVATLDRIHKMGILHGDIREHNIMIDKSKHVYFIDFAMSTECRSTKAFKQEINQLRALLNLDLLP